VRDGADLPWQGHERRRRIRSGRAVVGRVSELPVLVAAEGVELPARRQGQTETGACSRLRHRADRARKRHRRGDRHCRRARRRDAELPGGVRAEREQLPARGHQQGVPGAGRHLHDGPGPDGDAQTRRCGIRRRRAGVGRVAELAPEVASEGEHRSRLGDGGSCTARARRDAERGEDQNDRRCARASRPGCAGHRGRFSRCRAKEAWCGRRTTLTLKLGPALFACRVHAHAVGVTAITRVRSWVGRDGPF